LNFNYFILLILISSCGLKGNPSPPQGTNLPSVLEKYEDIKFQEELDETKSPN